MLETARLGCSREGHRVLHDVSLAFASGSICLVTGPNGAGKTSLLRCLAGLDPHDAGEVRHRGIVVDTASEAWKAAIALVADDNALFDELTVEEHVVLACALAGIDRREARVRMAPLLELLSLDRYGAHRSTELSFGYRKRLAIALSLIHASDVYLFDEPLVGLDVTALDVFRGLLGLLRARGRVVIVASHIIAPLAGMADATARLADGRVDAAGGLGGEGATALGPADLPWIT